MRPTCLLALLLPACLGSVAGEAPEARPPVDGATLLVSLELEPGTQTIAPGQAPELRVMLANAGALPLQVVQPLDGSDVAWRHPHCVFDVRDAEGRPLPVLLGRCGNTNLLQLDNFRQLPADGSLELYGPTSQSAFFGNAFIEPGTYTLRFTYATDADDLRSWMGGPVGPDYQLPAELVQALGEVPRMRLTSDPVTIVVAGER